MDSVFQMGNNVSVPMTRRYPRLKKKQLERDAKIIKKLIPIWDVEQDREKFLQSFLKYKDKLSPERYWETLRSVWIVCGSVENVDVFRELFTADKRSRHYFSTPEEHEYLRSLPDVIKVYRAADSLNDGGISWTLSKEYAEEYRRGYSKAKVFSKLLDKRDVLAYINRNQEEEIITL